MNVESRIRLDPPASPDGARLDPEDGLDLRALVADVLDHWAVVLGVALFTTLCGIYRAWVAVPLYRAEALIQIETRSSGYTLPDAMMPMPTPRTGDSVETQLEIIRSRSVLAEAVASQHLDLVAKPIYLGDWGRALARAHDEQGTAGGPPFGLPGLGRYAWGGERLRVGDLQVPASWLGLPFVLTAGPQGRFSLSVADGPQLLEGGVGQAVKAKLPDGGALSIFVTELAAQPGTEFQVMRVPVNIAVVDLQSRMTLTERGDRTGIVTIGVTDFAADTAAAVANAVAQTFLRLNVERLSQEAENKLQFLNTQLPRLETEVHTAEQALAEHRTKSGVFELSAAAESLLGNSTEVQRKLSEVDLEIAELGQVYTAQHPLMVAAQQKKKQLLSEQAELEHRLAGVPDKEARLLQLKRDAEVANQLYLSLLNKAQELRIAKAGTVGNVRIIDSALPPLVAAEPNRRQIVRAWSSFGLLAGLLLAVLVARLRAQLRSAEEIEHKVGLPVFAVIPHSPNQNKMATPDSPGPRVLSWLFPRDPTAESFRSLRASLHFAQMSAENNIVAITGPTPGVGKSFVAMNLAAVAADAGRKVLLIDADLRKGHLHDALHLSRGPGLSELISGQCERAQAIRSAGREHFHFVGTGQQPPNPTELLSNVRFREFLDWAAQNFDTVIVDTAPIMNLADGVLVARQSGTVFLVGRERRSTYTDLRSSIKRLLQAGLKVDGVIFNGLASRVSGYMRYSAYYTKYRSYYEDQRPDPAK